MKGLTGCGKGVREESKGSEVGDSALWMEGVDGLTMTARRVVEAPRIRCVQAHLPWAIRARSEG
jgi:hypothetical protein